MAIWYSNVKIQNGGHFPLFLNGKIQNGFHFVQFLDPIWIPNHSASEPLSTIWISDTSGIQVPTVFVKGRGGGQILVTPFSIFSNLPDLGSAVGLAALAVWIDKTYKKWTKLQEHKANCWAMEWENWDSKLTNHTNLLNVRVS